MVSIAPNCEQRSLLLQVAAQTRGALFIDCAQPIEAIVVRHHVTLARPPGLGAREAGTAPPQFMRLLAAEAV
jgi:hypothetical protein